MFKSIATLTVLAAVTTTFALPAHAIFVGNGLSINGLGYNGTTTNALSANALEPNGLQYNGTDARARQGRVLAIELPRE